MADPCDLADEADFPDDWALEEGCDFPEDCSLPVLADGGFDLPEETEMVAVSSDCPFSEGCGVWFVLCGLDLSEEVGIAASSF